MKFLNVFQNPLLFITTILIIGVIFVNGWTDAPNAIATCVATRALTPKRAVIMSAVFNLLGVLCMTSLNASVADTVFRLADFGDDPHTAVVALCAALCAIILWAVTAWYFGIPTSESHALIAGLSGSAIALQNNTSGIRWEEWRKVLFGLFISTVLGFLFGWLCTRLTAFTFRHSDRLRTVEFFKKAQIAGGAAMSFMHGAQDGQKFIGVLLLLLSMNGTTTAPFWMLLTCSAVMALGTSVGGHRIIKAVGLDMVRLEPYQGFSADLGGAVCLLFCSVLGIPVSTTHTKTSAVMGVGAARRLSAVNFNIVRDMVLTWVLTFPGCGCIGYVFTKLLT